MEDDNNFDLNDNSGIPAEIKGLQTSNKSVIVSFLSTSGIPDSKCLEIPNGLEKMSLSKLVISYLSSSKFKRLTGSSRYVYYLAFKDLFNFFSEYKDKSTLITSTAVLNVDFLNYCRNKEIDPYTKYICLKQPLAWGKEQNIKKGVNVKGWDKVTQAIEQTLPNLQKPRYNAKKSLSQIPYADENISDETYLIGIRNISVWFLNELQASRQNLLQHSKTLRAYVQELNSAKPEDIPLKQLPRGVSQNLTAYGDRYIAGEELYAEIFNVAIKKRDELLIELLFYSQKNNIEEFHKGTRCSIDLMISALKKMLSKDKKKLLRNYQWWKDEKSVIRNIISTYSLKELVYPGIPEATAICWLLSSDRIQYSGIMRLRLDQVYIDSKKLQITNFLKFRADKNDKHNSVIYHKNTNNYRVIKDWIDLVEASRNIIKNNRDGYFIPYTNLKPHGLGGVTNNHHLSLDLLGSPGSHINQRFRNEVTGSNKMLNLFEKTVRHTFESKIVTNYKSNKNRRGKDLSKKYQEWGVDLTSEKGRLTISTENIAMSRVWQDQGLDKITESRSRAHSEATNKNVYKDRSTVKSIHAKASNFASQVGDLMESDARKVKTMLNSSKIFSLKDIRIKLGISTPLEEANENLALEEIYEKAAAKDYVVDILGELSTENKHYVIATPLTACLIKGYVDHIDDEMNKLFADNPLRAKKFQIKKAYLIELFAMLPVSIQEKGKELLSSHPKIPYPTLI